MSMRVIISLEYKTVLTQGNWQARVVNLRETHPSYIVSINKEDR